MTSSAKQEMEQETALDQTKHNTHLSLDQLQQLITLLDRSDIAEIEVNRANQGLHLMLRKRQATDARGEKAPVASTGTAVLPGRNTSAQQVTEKALHLLKAPLVGTFRTQGKSLVAPGDLVKIGQIVGAIEMLAILNELKSSVSGRVIEVAIQDGQSVEYGQTLLTIDTSENR